MVATPEKVKATPSAVATHRLMTIALIDHKALQVYLNFQKYFIQTWRPFASDLGLNLSKILSRTIKLWVKNLPQDLNI